MNTESYVFYESVQKQALILYERMGAETALQFLLAVNNFGLYGEVPEVNDEVWLYGFEQTMTSIQAAKDRRQQQIDNGKKGGRPKTIDDSKVIELHTQGVKTKEIAETLHCSVSSVEKIVAETRKNP